jgi:hypothetical protein
MGKNTLLEQEKTLEIKSRENALHLTHEIQQVNAKKH